MKNILSTVFISLIFLSTVIAQDWKQMSILPVTVKGRHHPVAFGIGNNGYYLTGGSETNQYNDDFYKYDNLNDSWEKLNDFPGVGRGYAIGIEYEGKGYTGFGTNGNADLNDLWEFDPVTEEWKSLLPCPCSGRFHPALLAAGGKIYVGLGGSDLFGNLQDWWAYDIATNSWEEKATFPGVKRHHPFQFSIGEFAYVGFGHGDGIFNDMYRYDSSEDKWTQMATLPAEGRVAGTQFSYNGKGYVLSGDGDDHFHMPTGEFWEYDPTNDSWKSLPPHPGQSRWAPASFVIDNKVFFTSGLSTVGLEQDLFMYEFENTTSTENEKASEIVSIYPNPTADFINISDERLLIGEWSLEIYSIEGKLIHQQNSFQNNLIDVSTFSNGEYFLKLSNEKEILSGKFSIIK